MPKGFNHNVINGTVKGIMAVKGFNDGNTPFFPERNLRISGVSKDSTGAALGICTVKLFDKQTDLRVDDVVSDASGNYITQIPKGLTQTQVTTWYLVMYKAGSPDVAGTSRNDLVGI